MYISLKYKENCMKKAKKHFWIIALVAIITSSFVTCDNGNEAETFTVTSMPTAEHLHRRSKQLKMAAK
jgi:hypothetical protein